MKNTKMIALASALCTAFTCTSASLTAFSISSELPEGVFWYENILIQVVPGSSSDEPHLVVTGFTKEALDSTQEPTEIHVPPYVETCIMPSYDWLYDYEYLPVTEIGAGAFKGCKHLLNVFLPFTIEKINDNAFDGCLNLSDVDIVDIFEEGNESHLTTIGSYAFNNCRNLQYITLPDSLDVIRSFAFRNCSSLKSISIRANMIEEAAFGYCENLSDVTILNSNAQIMEQAFFNDAVANPKYPEDIEKFLFYGTIHGYRGSTAQEYAEMLHTNFAYLSQLDANAGDLTGDKAVSVDDAQLALMEYTAVSVAGKNSTLTFAQRKNADINRDGAVSVEDAQLILKYYVQNTVAGVPTTWEDLLYGKITVAEPEKPVTTPAVTTTTEACQTTTMPATTVVVIQTTSAPAVTTAAAATSAPVLTTAAASTKAPLLTTAAPSVTTAAPLLTTAAAQ